MRDARGLSDGTKIALILGFAAVVVIGGTLASRPSIAPQPAQGADAPTTQKAQGENVPVPPADENATADSAAKQEQAGPATHPAAASPVTTQLASVEPTTVRISADVVVKNATRLGINLGAPEPYGAGNFLKNLIHNPGFESGIFRSMMHADEGSTADRVPQAFWTTEWNVEEWGIGQNPGFWNGAAIEFLFGSAKGRQGTVRDYRHEGTQHVFYVDPSGPAPKQWDVFVVRKELEGLPGAYAMNPAIAAPGETRPGSPGKQSLYLQNPAGEGSSDWRYFMDSTYRDDDPSAGKLYLVEGPWRLSFWAKGGNDGDALAVDFSREGEAQFFSQTVAMTGEWKEYSFEFDVPKGQDALRAYGDSYKPILTFQFALWDEGAKAWIDDVVLSRRDHTNPTEFADTLVNTLKAIHPGIVRKWAGQLGNSLDNELAEPFARKTYEHNPRGRRAGNYGYSLHEFLRLCQLLNADPWYVVPPTFTSKECAQLIEYLAAPSGSGAAYAEKRAALGQTEPWTSVFHTIHLEFGNEMWGEATPNDPFYGGSAMGGERLAHMASDRFALMKASPFYDGDKFDCIIGGQASWPGRQEEIDRNSEHHDSIAIAPYFGGLETFKSRDEIYPPLFAYPTYASTLGPVRGAADALNATGKGTNLAVYEINYHTTGGPAPEEMRNRFVAGASGAIALPLHMLLFQRDHGARAQCAFTLNQYSFAIGDLGHVRIWGVVRDLFATGRVRPTGLGLSLANAAIQGDMVRTSHQGQNPGWVQKPINGIEKPTTVPFIHSFAFRSERSQSLILFNVSMDREVPVIVQPDEPSAPKATLSQIRPEDIDTWNEDDALVRVETIEIADFAEGYGVTLPPHSMSVLTWQSL
ncbi:MAG: hypothetical protein AMXMBFR84_04270 [Candidatus Hydrogenedentota bacterium]